MFQFNWSEPVHNMHTLEIVKLQSNQNQISLLASPVFVVATKKRWVQMRRSNFNQNVSNKSHNMTLVAKILQNIIYLYVILFNIDPFIGSF